ncbi:cobalt-precorrin-6A reductase [Chitinasiproducens palmae]|uniref:Precorrin-6A reductase n=1 Tax=Chitinasiproducens palmae TaxID=1770053 RepID=A0A1H2PRZ1_9BURK|nr:cobalt-precorrin-6A reductase [Chitinasiproducens palmae]SDV49709.1 precorrin-6A reductase [Chitinasiproducens palmae]
MKDESAPRVLLLGGTGDALRLADGLAGDDVYSLAGLGRVPETLACAVRVGGYGGADGLADYLRRNAIALLIDATHPYAARISANAAAAADRVGVPCWALRRPAWTPGVGDDWREWDDWAALRQLLAPFGRPLFTNGRAALAHLDAVPATQHWHVRVLDPQPGNARATVLAARGPFSLDDERALFERLGIDVLVSKNSGGPATEAKLRVARERGVPVMMQRRPMLPAGVRCFDAVDALASALRAWRRGGYNDAGETTA